MHAAERLEAAANRLVAYPRNGERLEGFENRELRRIMIGKYEMRYEVRGVVISIIRIFMAAKTRHSMAGNGL